MAHPLENCANAQRTRPFCKKAFLTCDECDDVCNEVDRLRMSVGSCFRDASGSHCSRGQAVWETLWLHTEGKFYESSIGTRLADNVISLARSVDEQEGWNMLRGRDVNIRVIESHRYHGGGGLAHETHHDRGSLITIDIMLRDDFVGGEFATLEADGVVKTWSDFAMGDAMVFASNKYHKINPVLSGMRQVIVFEIWDGPRRTCAHRCTKNPRGENAEPPQSRPAEDGSSSCGYSLRKNIRENMMMFA